jgi:hypothetical protein
VLTFEWNALRIGDPVRVHDRTSPTLALVDGTVMMVDTRRGTNDLGIAVTSADGATTMLRPERLSVHRRPTDDVGPCWQCEAGRAAGVA